MAQGDQFFLTSSDGKTLELSGELSVGRSADCDLVLSDGQPSRHHAQINVTDDGVAVEDLNSTNGTFINGERVTGSQLLSDGDELAFDVNKFAFSVKSAAVADATVMRQVEDPNRTILRAAPTQQELQAEIEQAEVKKEAPPAAEPASVSEPAPAPVKPGSWADPNEKNASSTQFFSPEDLAAMRGATVQEKVESDVPFLQVASGSAAGSVIQLIPEGDKKEWTIGADQARDIVFSDQGISDFHTILAHENGRWKVVDQMSTNGTFVNGSKTVSAYLNSGDKIRIGTVECSFMLPGGAAAGKPSGGPAGGNNKTAVGVVAFVVVLAVMFGAYYFLM